jgi:aminoglycoside phosphotransferase (APT) family kinase protein
VRGTLLSPPCRLGVHAGAARLDEATNEFVLLIEDLDGERASFLDWGLIQLGNPMRDVGYFITMALSPENRRSHERALIERYLEARREAGGSELSFDEAWRLHPVHAAYAVPAACPLVLFPEDQTEENARLAEAFLERSMSVAEHLDIRTSLRESAGL